jgi:hypothetical protein
MLNPNSVLPSPQPFDLSINASVDAMNSTMQQFFGNIPNTFQQQIIPNPVYIYHAKQQIHQHNSTNIVHVSHHEQKHIISIGIMLWIQFEAPNIYWSSMQHLQKR